MNLWVLLGSNPYRISKQEGEQKFPRNPLHKIQESNNPNRKRNENNVTSRHLISDQTKEGHQ